MSLRGKVDVFITTDILFLKPMFQTVDGTNKQKLYMTQCSHVICQATNDIREKVIKVNSILFSGALQKIAAIWNIFALARSFLFVGCYSLLSFFFFISNLIFKIFAWNTKKKIIQTPKAKMLKSSAMTSQFSRITGLSIELNRCFPILSFVSERQRKKSGKETTKKRGRGIGAG